jgi:hypothetical protein
MSTATVETVSKAELKVANLRDELLLRIKGQTAHIPNLEPLFYDWDISYRPVSQWLEPLREKVKTRLQR